MVLSKEQRRAYDATRRKGGKRERTRSSNNAHGARTAKRKRNEVTFVGLDGEGVDRDNGDHDYNLLSVGDESLYHPDGRRLTTDEIFSFLWEQYDPKKVYVGFFLGYDFSQWLRDLPEDRAAMLLTKEGQAARRRTDSNGNTTPFPVGWGRWEFDLLPNMKRFKLRPQGAKIPWLYVCDSGPLYQCSFENAIDPAQWPAGTQVCTSSEFEVIRAGKAARGDEVTVPRGTPVDRETIRYNLLENELLARLMGRTNEGLMNMDVKLKKTQWFGPGQAAQAWMRNEAAAHTGEACRDAGPAEAFEAARMSYFGGWFEIMAHGPVAGVTWEYDINSAYPHIIAGLPCLLHGTWTHGEGAPPRRKSAWRLVRATVRGSDPIIGPMPHRMYNHSVRRPTATEGWMWQHELTASRRAGLIDRVKWHEWWEYTLCDCAPPFRAIGPLYRQRIEIGKDSPQGKGMKLVYNSTYGKTAQSIGKPIFGNAVYASLITAGCRTMILDAIATHPLRSNGVVMVATDGVYFTEPHPTLHVDKTKLGAWGMKTKLNLSLLKPGVYWDDQARADIAEGGRLDVKSRGINVKELAKVIGDIDEQWVQFGDVPNNRWGDVDVWPTFDLDVPFSVISPKQALNRNRWELCGTITHHTTVTQSACPTSKRAPIPPTNIDDLPLSPTFRTSPWQVGKDVIPSEPYEAGFGLEIEATFAGLPEIPEGDLMILLSEHLGLR